MNLEKLTGRKKVIAVVCNQWGDTGKGKLVDWLASEWADYVVRGTGAGNAGHTIRVKDLMHICHTIPCGILNPKIINVIGKGVGFDPRGVCEELDELAEKGFYAENLKIAYNSKLILPQHLVLDRIKEAGAGSDKIGTTGRGVGPVYTDYVARLGLFVNDMLNKDVLARKLKRNLRDKLVLFESVDRNILKTIMQHEHLEKGIYWDRKNIFDIDEIIERYSEYGRRLEQFIVDADELMRTALVGKKRILLEGAQGHMLSIDYGTYPYVTSSDCSITGLVNGSGLKESDVDLVLGVVKCPYMTRVGEGPFPTELGGETSAKWCSGKKKEDEDELVCVDINHDDPFRKGIAVRRAGGEYGATTGRPRRTGWLDLPLLRYAMLTNGKDIVLTKLQVFDNADEIRICTSYTYKGQDYKVAGKILTAGARIDVAIPDIDVMRYCEPDYISLPGWHITTQNIKSYNSLPSEMKNLVDIIESQTKARVRVLSMGPDRSQTIVR